MVISNFQPRTRANLSLIGGLGMNNLNIICKLELKSRSICLYIPSSIWIHGVGVGRAKGRHCGLRLLSLTRRTRRWWSCMMQILSGGNRDHGKVGMERGLRR